MSTTNPYEKEPYFIRTPDIRALFTGLEVLSFHEYYRSSPPQSPPQSPPLCPPASPPSSPHEPCLFRRDYCDVSLLRAPNHELRIFIDEISRKPGNVSSRRIFADIKSTHIKPFDISLEVWQCPKDLPVCEEPNKKCYCMSSSEVTQYRVDPFDGDRLEREAFQEYYDGSFAGSDDPRDYRWAIDLSCADFHGSEFHKGKFEHDAFSHVIRIHRGQFYTASRTTDSFDRVTIARRGRAPKPDSAAPAGEAHYTGDTAYVGEKRFIGRIARVVGANIALQTVQDRSERAFLRVEGANGSQTLMCFDTANYTYKVAFVNLHPPHQDSTVMASDFLEYGNLLKKDPYGFELFDRYDLQPTSRPETKTAPCATVTCAPPKPEPTAPAADINTLLDRICRESKSSGKSY
jgi:hypothetical protein